MKNKLIQLLIFVIFLSLIFNRTLIISEISSALHIFIFTLFPSIFPFFVVSNLLINYNFHETLNKIFSKIINFLFHTSNASNFVIIMSIFSGFPSGTKYIRDLYDKNLLNIDQANYLITFTHFSNPLFVLILTNNIFNNQKISYLILIAHILSNILLGIIIRPKKSEEIKHLEKIKPLSFSNALTNSITSSLNLLLLILGNTCFFFIVTGILTSYLNFNLIEEILINGFFDLSKGISEISFINNHLLFKSFLVLTFLAFGGINIHMQILSIIENTKIKYKNFLYGRISQIALSILIFTIEYYLFTNGNN